MGSKQYTVVAQSSAAPEVVFQVLADGPNWSRWIKLIDRAHYEREGSPAPHGVGAIRVFGPKRGPLSREEVVEYSPPDRFAYTILTSILPIKGYRGTVVLEPNRAGTLITWSGTFTTRVPGMTGFLRRTVGGFAMALAREAERQQAPGA